MLEIAKPRELLAARTSAEVLFGLLRAWFGVPAQVVIDLRAVDGVAADLADPRQAMAMAMRKLQSLHRLASPGVRTTTDVVLTVIQDIDRSLSQAPLTHLRTEAAAADWDAELAALGTVPPATEGVDEVERFRHHLAAVRAAGRAVLRASDGQVCLLV